MSTFETGPDAPFIASRFIPHDGSRRGLAGGAFIDGEPRIEGPPGARERIGRALRAGRRQRQADEVLLAALGEALADAHPGEAAP